MGVNRVQWGLWSLAIGLIGSLLWLTLDEPRLGWAALVPRPTAMGASDHRVAAATLPPASAYDLGQVSLIQAEVPAPLQALPLPLQGWIARPAGAGPFPVVVILHGRHPGCHFALTWADSTWPCPAGTETRFDQGFVYLAQALAGQGYLTLAINLNGAYAYAYGATPDNYNTLAIQRSAQILEAHLTHLAAANRGESLAFGPDLKGRVDLSQLVLIGHSLGGGAAVQSSLLRQRQTHPEQIQQGRGRVSGLLLLAPTPSQAIALRPDTYALPDVPAAVLLGGCDRDIYDFSSLYYFEAAAQDVSRSQPLSSVLIPGANHNFFNRALPEDDYARQPDADPLCRPSADPRLPRQAQEQFLVAYASDFVRTVLGTEAAAAPGSDPSQAAPGSLYRVPVLTNLSLAATQQHPILSLAAADPERALPPPIQPGGTLAVQLCPALRACGQHWRPRPRFPTVLRLSWQQGSGQLNIPLSPADQAVQAFDSLQLRVAVDATDALNDGIAQAFAVVLTDRQGRAARVEIPTTTPALRGYAADPRWGYQGIPIYPSAVRIPLGQFKGVDLAAIATITLVFDQSQRGVLYLADLAFLQND